MAARFLHNWIRTDSDVFLEALLPSGSITGVFRNEKLRLIVLEGVVDKLDWSISQDNASESASEVLKLIVPENYIFSQIGVSLDAKGDRVLLKLPLVAS